MSGMLTVCICGGGNASHTMMGLAASREQTDVRVLTLFQDEAERWTNKLKEGDFTVVKKESDGSMTETKSQPTLVTNDPSKAVTGADLIIFCVPAFAHKEYLTAIAPLVKYNSAIVGLPGQPGFEFQCFSVLKDVAKQCSILSYESLPWACRIETFGQKVEILGDKTSLMGSIVVGKSLVADKSCEKFDPIKAMQRLIGDHTELTKANNFIEPYLMTKSIVHPPLLYAKWKNWDGQPLDTRPLFYQGLDLFGAACLSGLSDDCVKTARAIEAKKPRIVLKNVLHLLDTYRDIYKETIGNDRTLLSLMRSNSAYEGLVHPMKKADNEKWEPDFKYRYLVEDVPYGIVVTKGLAQIAGVDTPMTDVVLAWCQEKLGKEFIVESELKGKDLALSRAPQAYGYNTLDDLEALL